MTEHGKGTMGQQQTIEQWFAQTGATFKAVLVAMHENTPWSDGKHRADHWQVTFERGNVSETFDFWQGVGHRRKLPDSVRALFVAGRGGRGVFVRPGVCKASAERHGFVYVEGADAYEAVAPDAPTVLDCLVSDADAIGLSFEAWADEFGMDTDSRRAEATYRACLENAQKLLRLFGLSGLEALRNCERL